MSFYSRMNATATRLIGSYGQTVTLERSGTIMGPAYDPAFRPSTQYQVRVLETKRRSRDAAGALTEDARRSLVIAAQGTVPTKDDRILLNGAWQEIEEVRPVSPGGTDLLYEVDLRP